MPYLETSLKLDQLAPGESRCLTLGEAQVGVFRTRDGLFALDNICPHRGAPLDQGFVTNGQVSCPWHQWQFQLEDGVCSNIPKVRIASYGVEVRDGTIWINLDDQGEKTS